MSQTPVDRREFARLFTAGAITSIPLAAAAVASAAEEKDPAKTPTPAELILDLVKRQYPERLEAEQLALIRKDIEGSLARSRVLGSFPLVNADEPAFVFAAYRKEGG